MSKYRVLDRMNRVHVRVCLVSFGSPASRVASVNRGAVELLGLQKSMDSKRPALSGRRLYECSRYP